MRIERFQPEHLMQLTLQPDQVDLVETLCVDHGQALALGGPAFTIFDEEPVACMGAIEHHAQRCELWALLSGRCMKFVTQAARGWLAQAGYARVEAVVACQFAMGHKWVAMLGFTPEGPARLAFMPNGDSAITYVRLRLEAQ